MAISKFLKAFLLSALLSLAAFAGEFKVDTAHTKVAFSVKHMMVTNVRGYFKKFDGEFSYDEKTKTIKALTATVMTDSIDTDIEKRDNHLRSSDFFDAAKFPKMSFKFSKYESKGDNGKVHGELTIKNITKPVVFDAEIGGVATAPDGVKHAGLSLSAKINRKDFGLTWNKALETGGVVVGDEVKIQIDIEGIEK